MFFLTGITSAFAFFATKAELKEINCSITANLSMANSKIITEQTNNLLAANAKALAANTTALADEQKKMGTGGSSDLMTRLNEDRTSLETQRRQLEADLNKARSEGQKSFDTLTKNECKAGN